MANRETYPASQSPLTGDISGPAGATSVTVVGLQTNPVASGAPLEQSRLTWNAVLGAWEPEQPGNMSVLINGTPDSQSVLTGFTDISDDYDFLVNCVGLDALVSWTYGFTYQVFVNGTGVV
jgi:hypothetical protein